MAQLTSLELAMNAISDAGAASLTPSLALMARLTSLDLSYNSIFAAGEASLPRFATIVDAGALQRAAALALQAAPPA